MNVQNSDLNFFLIFDQRALGGRSKIDVPAKQIKIQEIIILKNCIRIKKSMYLNMKVEIQKIIQY